MTFAQLARRVRAHLKQDHRYAHVVRVARTAETLAMRHGLDSSRARLSGMLHDLARLYPADRLLRECGERGMTIDAYAARHPIVLHAPLGAELARELFAVDDAAVLSAIAKHTLGDGEMSALDSVLYLADALEPGRDFADRERLLALASDDLEAGMRATLRSTIEYLRKRDLPLAPQTARAGSAFGLTPDELEVCTA